MTAGELVQAVKYSRASRDKRHQQHSITQQYAWSDRTVEGMRWTDAGSYADNDRSASRRETRGRPGYRQLLDDIREGAGDVVVMFELSRGQRDLKVFTEMRDLCFETGLFFWHVGGNLYDLREPGDRERLGFEAVMAEGQSDRIAKFVRSGMIRAALDGRPHGQVTYGYKRIHNTTTGAFARQSYDLDPREAVADDGTTSTYTPHGIVVWLFESLIDGKSIVWMVRDLNRRGIPSPKGRSRKGQDDAARQLPREPGRWSNPTVRRILTNPAYIGKRAFRADWTKPRDVMRTGTMLDAQWEPIISEEQFTLVRGILSMNVHAPRKTTSAAKYLLSYIAECHCGSLMRASQAGDDRMAYVCFERRSGGGCASIAMRDLDEHATLKILRYLANRENVTAVLRSVDRSPVKVRAAQRKAQALKVELDEWRALGLDEDASVRPSPRMFAEREVLLTRQLAEAEGESRVGEFPPEVVRLLNAESLADVWAGLDMPERRNVVRTLFRVIVRPVGVGCRDGAAAVAMDGRPRVTVIPRQSEGGETSS